MSHVLSRLSVFFSLWALITKATISHLSTLKHLSFTPTNGADRSTYRPPTLQGVGNSGPKGQRQASAKGYLLQEGLERGKAPLQRYDL